MTFAEQVKVAADEAKKRPRTEYDMLCPICGDEIHEKGSRSKMENGEPAFIMHKGRKRMVNIHNKCGGEFIWPKTEEELDSTERWLKSFTGKSAAAGDPIEGEVTVEGEPPKKKKKSILPWLLLGSGAGLGLAGATMLPGRMRKGLEDFRDKAPGWANGKTKPNKALQEYADTGSRIMGEKMWGVLPAPAVIKALRHMPGLPAKERWDPKVHEDHYKAFAKGPISAYLQLAKEREGYDATLGTSMTNPFKFFRALGFTGRVQKGMDQVAQQAGGADVDSLSRGQQNVLAPLMHSVADKTVRGKKQMDNYMGPLMTGAAGRDYTKRIINPILKAPMVLGGAGAALAGGGLLGLYLQNRKKKDEEEEQPAVV